MESLWLSAKKGVEVLQAALAGDPDLPVNVARIKRALGGATRHICL